MADKVLTRAVDLARDAAVDAAGDSAAVGAHLGATEIEERLVTHQFACTLPGYRGWVWSATVTRISRGDATLCEAHLVPADDALLAPPWIPWAERVQPGDLEPSMVLPLIADDSRLVPGYAETSDEDADAVAIWEFGLGRERVLGRDGREDAAERWYRGSHGPQAPSANASAQSCVSCGFYLPIAGSLRPVFGVCANEWSPSDGSVVSVDHGCGAHSQTDVEKQGARWPSNDPVVDTFQSDVLDVDAEDPEEDAPPADAIDEKLPEAETPEAETPAE